MPYDPHKPLDEQPQRRWRWLPWGVVAVGLLTLVGAVVL